MTDTYRSSTFLEADHRATDSLPLPIWTLRNSETILVSSKYINPDLVFVVNQCVAEWSGLDHLSFSERAARQCSFAFPKVAGTLQCSVEHGEPARDQ